MRIHRALDHRIEGALKEDLHELVGRVVAARGLACVTAALALAGEGEGAPVLRDLRHELEEPLIDVAELVGAHVAPVHAHEPRGLAEPGQMEQRREQ